MVKRYGNLWNDLVSWENILLAYQLARKHKSNKRNVLNFEKNELENLKNIQASLINKTFKTSKYHKKIVFEPKQRIIYILPFNPDRIVQHALMNVLIPIWDKLFIENSFACRNGKGMHAGSAVTMKYVKKYKYCLKGDISKFYPSINHQILKNIIRRKIKDKDVLWLCDEIIDSFPGETNTPIGNFTSQWFGNLYMNELDMFVKHELRCPAYARYSDDFVLFSDDKKQLHDFGKRITSFVGDHLSMRLSKLSLFPVSQGVDFLGYRHFRKYILLRKKTALRVRQHLKRAIELARNNKICVGQFRSMVASYLGWMKYANTYNLRRHLELLRWFRKAQNARNVKDMFV